MCITEYNEVKTLADEREEGLAEGLEKGEVQGAINTLKSLVSKGLLSKELAAEEAHMSVAEFLKRAELV